jgi:group I intron endonuclease
MDNENYKVYKHTTPSNKVYIGITKLDVNQRWKNGNGYKGNQYFTRAISKYGWENIKHDVLYDGFTKGQAEKKEIERISLYKSDNSKFGYNIQHGGNVNCVDEETKLKISRAMSNRKVSRETREKLSELHKGKNNFLYGKHLSKEHREKISKANMGHLTSEETRKKISESKSSPVMCVETKIIYNNAIEAELQTGIKSGYIRSVCSGRRKTTGGFHWEYVK